MKFRVLVLLLLSLVIVMTGCEDSDVTAPDGSLITLTAQPASVFIDQTINETEGTVTLVAQVVDAGGLPLGDIPLFFTTTGGLLGSVENRCSAGACTRSVDVCATDGDCPVVPPDVLKSNNSGIVIDSLTLRLFEDPDMVTVTVKGTNLEQRAEINKNVNFGPIDALPQITASPLGGQRTGLPFSFDGSGSVHDELVEIECYDWQLLSNKLSFDANALGCESCPVPGSILCSSECSDRGPDLTLLTLIIGTVGDATLDQDIEVILDVSDDPTVVCENGTPVDPEKFTEAGETSISYLLRCDITPPFVEAGSNQSGSLSQGGGSVSFTFSATGSDQEDTVLDYTWDCGNGSGTGSTSQAVLCTYTSLGQKQATVTVQNDCGLITVDSLVVDIQP